MDLQVDNKIDTLPSTTLKMLADQRAAGWRSPPALALDAGGFIQECGMCAETIFGYRQHELFWQHISCLIPSFADIPLMQGNRIDPMLNYICHCDHVFEAVDKQGKVVACNLNFFLVENKGVSSLRLIVRPVANARF
ncbi:MAG: hypothetical protein HZB47_08460 [Nitrosomonadales bacterium]|nr:hypothetical protein [Nitrosomonadales bacterium]